MRLDKYLRQIFVKEMKVKNSISVQPKEGEEGNVSLIVGRQMEYHLVAVDNTDGSIQKPIIDIEYPNIDVLTSLGLWDPAIELAFTQMNIACFEAMGTEEYKTANADYYVTPLIVEE